MELKKIILSPQSETNKTFIKKWKIIIENDPTLEPIEFIMGVNPMTLKDMKVPAPNSARWNDHSENIPANFVYSKESKIEITYPDSEIRGKIAEIAKLLGATVSEEDWY